MLGNTHWQGSERRRSSRTQTAIQMELRAEWSKVPIRVQTTDICEDGCYVEMNITLELNNHVTLALWLGSEKLVVEGEVVTRHPQFGNGIQFGMSQQDRNKLAGYLKSIQNNDGGEENGSSGEDGTSSLETGDASSGTAMTGPEKPRLDEEAANASAFGKMHSSMPQWFA